MAVVTGWNIGFVALLPAFAIPVIHTLRGKVTDRLVALQLATAVASILLVVVTFVVDQPSFIDLALCLALLSLPASLAMAVFLERWL